MKKTYIIPAVSVLTLNMESMIAASVTGSISNETYNDDAGTKENIFEESIWDD